MNDLQTQTQYPILSYSGNSIRHFSTNGTKVSLSKNYTASEEVLYRALFLIPVCSIWGMAWKNPVVLNASKIFLHLLPGPNFPDNKLLHFLITLIWPSPTLDILGVSLTTKNLNCKSQISALAKSASLKLCVLYCLCKFFPLFQILALYSYNVRVCC